MENKAHAMAAGAFVLVVTALLALLAIWLTRDNTQRDLYDMSTSETVSGLQPQAAVRFRGVPVGKIELIGFDEKVKGNVLIRVSIDRSAPVTKSTFATVASQGVTGLGFIQLDDDGKSAERLAVNDDDPPRIPLKPSVLAQLQERGEAIIGQIEEVTKRANTLLGDPNQKRIADALESIAQATASANQLTRSLDNTVKNGLNPALAALPPLIERTKDTMGTVKAAASDVSRVANNANTTVTRLNAKDGPVERLSDGTRALAQAVDSFNAATLPRVNRVADDTSRAVRRLGRTADSINDNPQSLLFGNGGVVAGPGEPGFSAPAARP